MADKLPPALKGIQPFIAISKQFAKRDPVIAYYGKIELLSDDIQILLYLMFFLHYPANMFAVQEGIRLARSDATAKGYLLTLMDQMESVSG